MLPLPLPLPLPNPYPYPYQVALTNMELLRLLPWREGPTLYDGLPDKRLMLRVWLQVMLLEDVPQFTIQVSLCPSLNIRLPLPLHLTPTPPNFYIPIRPPIPIPLYPYL